MARQWVTFSGAVIDEDGTEEYVTLHGTAFNEDQATGKSMIHRPPHTYQPLIRM